MAPLDSDNLPPLNPWPRRVVVIALVALLAAGALYWQFRFYEEKQQVRRFMDALVAGDFRAAYRQWKPSPSYRYQDFLEDWGESNSWGRIKSYEIVSIEDPTTNVVLRTPAGGRGVQMGEEASGLIVSVRLNGIEPPVRIWVERKDKSLSFPPF